MNVKAEPTNFDPHRCVAECHESHSACRECQRHLLPRSDVGSLEASRGEA